MLEDDTVNPKIDYDAEPVTYCKHCLSLAIRGVDGEDYCDDCGSTDLGILPIGEWQELYRARFGKSYINK